MASTLSNRVIDIAGKRPSTVKPVDWNILIGEFLTATAREVFEIMPDEKLVPQAPDPATIDLNAGLTVSDKKILSVNCNGKEAVPITPGQVAAAKDVNSIHYADANSPVYYFKGGKIYPLPASGTWQCYYLPIPYVLFDDLTIPHFPPELESLVVLGAAVRVKGKIISELKNNIPAPLDSQTLQSVDLQQFDATTGYDFTTDLNTLNSYITDDEYEQAQAMVQKMTFRLSELQSEVSAEMQEKTSMLNRELQIFNSNLSRFSTELMQHLKEQEYLHNQYQESLQLMIAGVKQ